MIIEWLFYAKTHIFAEISTFYPYLYPNNLGVSQFGMGGFGIREYRNYGFSWLFHESFMQKTHIFVLPPPKTPGSQLVSPKIVGVELRV